MQENIEKSLVIIFYLLSKGKDKMNKRFIRYQKHLLKLTKMKRTNTSK